MDQFGLAVPVKLGQYPHLALSVPCPQSNVMSSVKCYFLSQMFSANLSNVTSSVKRISLGKLLSPQSNMFSVKCYVLSQMLHCQSDVMSWVKCCIVSQTLCPQSNVASSVKHYVLKLHILSQTICILYTGIIWHDYTFNWLSKWMWNSWMFKHAPHPPYPAPPPPPHTHKQQHGREGTDRTKCGD